MTETKKPRAVAYYRTSSATNVGEDKDSKIRQQVACQAYAATNGLEIVAEFYDAAVSGADPVDERDGFKDMLAYINGDGVSIVLVEDATRFARDLIVQLTGHKMLADLGVELIPVNAPTSFTDPSATAVLIQQVLGAISQFDKTQLVQKLKGARERKRRLTGRCEGPKPVPEATLTEVKRLMRTNPKTGKKRSLRAISAELAALGHLSPSGKPYLAGSIKAMVDALNEQTKKQPKKGN